MEHIKGMRSYLSTYLSTILAKIIPPEQNKPQRATSELELLQRQTREYLASLSEQDRNNVLHIMNVVDLVNQQQLHQQIGMIAVGSTVRPVEERFHEPRDIDLRILSTTEPLSEGRQQITDKLDSTFASFLTLMDNAFQKFEKFPFTITNKKWVKDGQVTQWVDYENTDPSFEITPHEGLPIHLLMSGPNSLDLDSHLREERRHNANSVSLDLSVLP